MHEFKLEDYMELVPIPGMDGVLVGSLDFNAELAELFLRNAESNRNPDFKKSQRFAHDMLEGRWGKSESGLGFTKENKLHDGQGRCHAMLMANDARPGISIRMTVFRGINSDEVRDQGQARTATHEQQRRGVPSHASVYAKAGGVLWLLERGPVAVTGTWTPTVPQVTATIEEWRSLLEPSISEITSLSKRPFRFMCGNIGWFVSLDCIFRRVNEDQARIFRRQFVLGEGLETGDPAFVCRGMLEKLAIDTASAKTVAPHRRKTWYRMALTIRAWNHFRSDSALSKLQQSPDPTSFPEISGWIRWHDVNWRPPKVRPTDVWLQLNGKAGCPPTAPPGPAKDDLVSEVRRRSGHGRYVYSLPKLRDVLVHSGTMSAAAADTLNRTQVEKALKAGMVTVAVIRQEVWGEGQS